MATISPLDVMRIKPIKDFDAYFDSLSIPHWRNYLSDYDVEALRKIATSKKLAGNMNKKYAMITQIMESRGFKRFAAGTNRIVFKYLEDERFLVKVAVDSVGINDNPAEYRNQWLLKPYCTKMFYVSECGTVGFCERAMPITSIQEFSLISESVFNIIYYKMLGKYVVEDIGTEYFMNWGVRPGGTPVILDYPYLFELDGAKIMCSNLLPSGDACCGEIDYDEGFNKLVCKKCGKRYNAVDLMKKDSSNNSIVISKGGKLPMKARIVKNGKVITQNYSSDYIVPPEENKPAICNTSMNVSIVKGGIVVTAVRDGKFVDPDDEPVLSAPKEETKTVTLNLDDRIGFNDGIEVNEVEEKVETPEVAVEPENEVVEEKVVEEVKPTAVSKPTTSPVVVDGNGRRIIGSNVTIKSQFITDDEGDY